MFPKGYYQGTSCFFETEEFYRFVHTDLRTGHFNISIMVTLGSIPGTP